MAALEYHAHYPGYTVSVTLPSGDQRRPVIPAVALASAADGSSLPAGSATDPSYSSAAPNSTAGGALTPAVSTNAFSQVVKAAPGNFYGGSITAGATAGLLIAYNATAAPANGAALTAANILGVVTVAANATAALGDYTIPDRFSVGVVLLFSTTLATFTQPANPAQFIRGRAA